MKNKKICIFLLIGLLVLSAVFKSSTAIATTRANTNGPIFYISSKGDVCFNKKIGKFGEFEEGYEYVSWFACEYSKTPLPELLVKASFKFNSQKDIKAFTKYLFGKKMKANKLNLDYKLPKLKGKRYKLSWIDYTYSADTGENEIMISLVSRVDNFAIIYQLDDKLNIEEISFVHISFIHN